MRIAQTAESVYLCGMKRSILFFVVLCGMSADAFAQEDTVRLNEVTVTATKELTPYRRQALSSTVLDSKMLRAAQVTSLKGVSALAPNLWMPDYGPRLTSAMYVRGVGSRINTPAVGLYVDDVPWLDKSGFDFDLDGVERIEVLRGPQGTIYGRNTLGGLVKVYSRSPMNYQGTDVHLGFASRDNHRRAGLTHYHHPTESFAFSAGGYYEGADGFFRNALTDKKVDDLQGGGARLRGIWQPNTRLSFDANARYDYSHEGAYPYFYEGSINPQAEQYADWRGTIANNREGSYRRSLLNLGLNTQYRMDRLTLNSVTAWQNLQDRMAMDQDFLPDDIYMLVQKQRINTLQEEVTLKGDVTGWWRGIIGLNFSYQWLRTKAPVTFGNDGVGWLSRIINSSLPDLTSAGMGPMSLTLAGDELTMGGRFDTPVLGSGLFFQSDLQLASRLTLTLGTRLDYEHTHMDYDAGADVGFDFRINGANPRNSIILNNMLASSAFLGDVSDDYLHLLPRAALRWDLDKECNVYASVSRGMRSGGYNVQMFSDLLQTEMRRSMMSAIETGSEAYLQELFANVPVMPGFDPQSHIDMIMGRMREGMPKIPAQDASLTTSFKPESSWNYEAGTHLGSSDGRWQGDASLFLIDTRNQQIARFSANGLGRMMVNAGESRSWGAEVSLRALPNRHFSAMASYGFADSEFRKYDDGSGVDYSGNKVPFAPRHTVNADAAYTFFFPCTALKSLQVGATYTGAGKVYWTESNSSSQDFYNLLAARAVIGTRWGQVELWGRNLTKTRYRTFYFESMGRGFCQMGKPMQVGVDLRVHF